MPYIGGQTLIEEIREDLDNWQYHSDDRRRIIAEKALYLLVDCHNDLLHWQHKARTLESELGDYKAQAQQMDFLTVKNEMRALRTKIDALETSLKLFKLKDSNHASND